MRIYLVIIVLLLSVPGLALAESDPVGTQVFTTPTAQTLDEGDLRVANTMLTLTQFNYGLTDDLQLGVQTVYMFWTGVDLKYRFFQSGNVEASVLAGGGLFMLNAEVHSLYARPVVSVRLSEEPDAARVSLGGSAVYNSTPDGTGVVANGFLSADVPINPHVKLMGELNYVHDPQRTFPGDIPDWTAGTVGARFHGERAAVDAGLFIPFREDFFPWDGVGVPLLSFSYLF